MHYFITFWFLQTHLKLTGLQLQFALTVSHYIDIAFFFLGPGNSFVDIYKGSETSLIIDKSAAELPVGKQVQFRVCAINLIGVGPWGFPYGLKVPV